MEKRFTRIANAVAHATGKPVTFVLCCLIVVGWAVSGPIFGFSDTWQLIINTGTTIITFLMVFLIQNTQNRDGAALQAKLDELIFATEARNQFVGIEHLTEGEVEEFRTLAEKAAKAANKAKKAQAEAEEAEAGAEEADRDAKSAANGGPRRSKSPARQRRAGAADRGGGDSKKESPAKAS